MMTSGRQEGQGVRLAGMRTVLLPDDLMEPGSQLLRKTAEAAVYAGRPRGAYGGACRGGRA